MPEEQNESRKINIRRGNYDSLDIYEITKDELEILKQGSPNSMFFNFAIVFFSIFISIGITLLTVSIENDRIYYTFVIVLVICFFAGFITIVLWLKMQNIFKKTIEKIESRIEEKDFEISEDSITPTDDK